MISNKKAILIATLCLVFGASVAFILIRPEPAKIDIGRNQDRPDSEVARAPQVITRTFTEENNKYSIKVEYPELQGLESQNLQSKVNNNIRSRVYARLAAFRAQNAEIFGTDTQDFPEGVSIQSSFEARYDVALVSSNFLSAATTYSEYISGAAHPSSFIEVFNYDLRDGEAVSLKGFLDSTEPSVGYLERLGQRVREDLATQLGSDAGTAQLINQGAAASFENYKNFNLERGGLVIFFDPYQVAPFAAGAPKVLIPQEDFLGPILQPSNSDTWWLG